MLNQVAPWKQDDQLPNAAKIPHLTQLARQYRQPTFQLRFINMS